MRGLAAAVLLLFVSFTAAAEEAPVTLDQIHHPALLIKTNQPGVFLTAPAVQTHIAMRVRGLVARAVVRQTFTNPSNRCVEAVYAFPLPDDATVDAMRLTVGARTIVGHIKERAEAARVYEEARSEGRKASLLEQHRPNLFTISLASLGAGESASIELEYQQLVTVDEHFSLRIPLAIGPRYMPGDAAPLPAVPHASGTRNPVTIEIDLDAGIPLDRVDSATHAIDTVPLTGSRMRIQPRDTELASDRDFELTWTPRLGAMPQSASFSETAGDQRYTLLMLFPPALAGGSTLPRETIYIIDTSGSMAGPSMEQAKLALLSAIRRLQPSDRFNVIEFDDDATRLFETSRSADRRSVEEALQWVEALDSDGGTEILGALQLALDGKETAGVVRQVVFITDGQVGNEAQIFDFIRKNLGATRVFTIGIGSAPNSYFMRNAARAGRGTFTHIGDVREVEGKMTALFRKLETPMVTNIAVKAEGAEVWPERVPDLYAGEPLIVTLRTPAKAPRALGRVVANGWNAPIETAADETQSGFAKLWARQKIDVVRDTLFTGASEEDVRKSIVALGLEHGLVTEHTSLVAVDETPAGADTKSCTSTLVPVNLPAGWGGIDGALPQTATGATLSFLAGTLLLVAAAIARLRS